jgi:hypothetical protein
LKNSVFANEQNFLEALARPSENNVGSHHQSDFQSVTFVSYLKGVGLPNIGFDGHAAIFCRRLIFEFFNRIDPSRNFAPTTLLGGAVAS